MLPVSHVHEGGDDPLCANLRVPQRHDSRFPFFFLSDLNRRPNSPSHGRKWKALDTWLLPNTSFLQGACLLTAFIAVLTFFFFVSEMPVPLKHDMVEAYSWGREFQLGYHQHPPFWAWLCGLWFSVFPSTPFFFALLSATNAAVGLWGTWLLTGELVKNPEQRLAARALPLLTPFFTFYAFKFDANTIFISLWPWTLLFFYRASERHDRRATLCFGLLTGLCLLSKYYVLLPLAGCALAALTSTNGRNWLRSRQPWIAGALIILVISPHLWWLTENQAPPLTYLHSRLNWPWAEILHRLFMTGFGLLGMMTAVIGLTALVCARAGGPRAHHAAMTAARTQWTALVTLTPVVLTLAFGIVLRTPISSEMMIGVVPLLPLLVLQAAGTCPPRPLARAAVSLVALGSLGLIIGAPAFMYYRVHTKRWVKQIPYEEVAREGTRLWQERVHTPLTYVGGSAPYSDFVTFYSSSHPHSFPWHDRSFALWVTPERIHQHGLLSICESNDSRCLGAASLYATPGTVRIPLAVAHHFGHYEGRMYNFTFIITPPTVP
jgi:hypothetical protein